MKEASEKKIRELYKLTETMAKEQAIYIGKNLD